MKFTLSLLVACLSTTPAVGAVQQVSTEEVTEVFHLGISTGAVAGSGEQVRLAFEQVVQLPGVASMWIDLTGTRLGPGSYVSLHSRADSGFQVLDRSSLPDWNMRSAIFNGDAVLVQLWVAPGDPSSKLVAERAVAGLKTPDVQESLCGSDDRVASSDNRSGRIRPAFCTGWRVTNGAMLTAGHCGSLTSSVLEFNVPDSSSSGAATASDPNDQYPIDSSSVIQQNGVSLGDDWCLFAVNRNSNTGLLPHEAYGLPHRVTQLTPVTNTTTRVTGFGGDETPPGSTGGSNNKTVTNQTSTGPFDKVTLPDPDTAYMTYSVDTEGGNSGSPVIWESFDVSFGIHTNAGCSGASGSANTGTSFKATDLADVLNDFRGGSVVYVDAGHPLATTNDGTVFRPLQSFTAGVSAVPTGGVISLVAGTYSAGPGNAVTLTKAMVLESPTGSAVIGN